MRVILDTHALLWLLADDERLSAPAREALADDRTEALVSAVAVWEIAIKSALGKLDAPDDLLDVLDAYAFEALPVTHIHAWAMRSFAAHHRDPFDRLLVAQAGCERAVMLSADPIFAAYGIETIW